MPGPVTAAEMKRVLVEEGGTFGVDGIFPRAREEVGLNKEDVLVRDLLGAS